MLKQLLISVLLGFLAVLPAASAEDEAAGLILAKVSVKDGEATVESVHSSLPEDVLAQLHGTLKRRALQEARSEKVSEANYSVGIEWQMVSLQGKKQLAFEFANTGAAALQLAQADPPPSMYSVMEPVSVNIEISVTTDGEAELESCEPNHARHGDACKQIIAALRKSEFSPGFVDGIAVKSKLRDIIVFRP